MSLRRPARAAYCGSDVMVPKLGKPALPAIHVPAARGALSRALTASVARSITTIACVIPDIALSTSSCPYWNELLLSSEISPSWNMSTSVSQRTSVRVSPSSHCGFSLVFGGGGCGGGVLAVGRGTLL